MMGTMHLGTDIKLPLRAVMKNSRQDAEGMPVYHRFQGHMHTYWHTGRRPLEGSPGNLHNHCLERRDERGERAELSFTVYLSFCKVNFLFVFFTNCLCCKNTALLGKHHSLP